LRFVQLARAGLPSIRRSLDQWGNRFLDFVTRTTRPPPPPPHFCSRLGNL